MPQEGVMQQPTTAQAIISFRKELVEADLNVDHIDDLCRIALGAIVKDGLIVKGES